MLSNSQQQGDLAPACCKTKREILVKPDGLTETGFISCLLSRQEWRYSTASEPGNEIATDVTQHWSEANRNELRVFELKMNNGQGVEGIIAVQEERTRIGGVDVTKKTLLAATDEG